MRGGSFFHFRFELALHFATLAFEKITRGLHLFAILFARNDADAWRSAMFQVAIETMLVIRFTWREHTAAAQIELLTRERHNVAERRGIHERSEVACAVGLLQPRENEIWDGVIQVHLEHQVALVVTQADVEAWFEFLDEFAFEQECFRFAANDVDVKIVNCLDKRVEFQVPPHAP